MKTIKDCLLIVAVTLILGAACPAFANTTFNFQFDNDPTPGIQTPLVGSGSFTFANDPGNGTFAFNSLGAFSMSFSFVDGETITQADILSDLSLVQVILSPFGSGRRLQFTDTGMGGGGPFAGSIDFINAQNAGLSFEPSYNGTGLRLYFTASGNDEGGFFGDYLATTGGTVPDTGSTAVMMFLSLAGIIGLHRLPVRFARTRR